MSAFLLLFLHGEGLVVKLDGIACYCRQTDTANCRRIGTEVSLQQALRETNGLEDLRTSVGADGRDTHFCHNLEQTFLKSLYVVGLGRSVVLLYLSALHQVVEDSVCHVRAESRRTITQEQCGVHHLTYLSRLHYKSGLYALSYGDEIVVYGAHCQQ